MSEIKNKYSIGSPSEETIEGKTSRILELINSPKPNITKEEKNEIKDLALKGLEYMKGIDKFHALITKKDFTYSNVLKKYLVKIGLVLEKKKSLEEENANVLEKTEAKLELTDLVNGLEENFGIKQNLKFIPTLKPVEENKEDEEETLKNDRIELNEEFLFNEVVGQAKRDADTKETQFGNGPEIANGQSGSSLVVDLDVQKVEAKIKAYDEILNPVQKQEEEPENKEKVISEQKKSNNKGRSNYFSKKLQPKKKLEDKALEKKAVALGDIQNKIDSLRQKFLRNQEITPVVLEQEKFETILSPIPTIQLNKDDVIKNMLEMQQKSRHGITPDSLVNEFGSEERKVKTRLK